MAVSLVPAWAMTLATRESYEGLTVLPDSMAASVRSPGPSGQATCRAVPGVGR